MLQYYDLLGAMPECEIAEWCVTFGSRYGDGGAESVVVTQRILVGRVNGNRRQPSLGNTRRASIFGRTVPFPKGLRRMGCVRPQSLAATVSGDCVVGIFKQQSGQ
jgi:hypothetical protein